MVKDAEEHAVEDRKMKDIIDSRNRADSLIYSVEKSLRDFGDKISEEEKKNIENSIEKLKEVMRRDNKAAIEAEMENVQKASYKLAEEMYAKTSQSKGRASQGPEKAKTGQDSGKEEAVDADYEVVDEPEEKEQ